ncbi:MAG: hypothetical protein CMF01_16040, partial [Hyphomonas sp.]|nr:hypothetical protein [Hyphomonas sp.]
MLIVFAYCLFRSLALAQPLTGGAPASDRFSVEDLLGWEGVGEAVSDPEEGWIFFERIRPYREIGDYSFRLNAFRNSGHQVWRYKAGSGSEAELLPGIDQTPSTYIVGLSPSGTNLAILQYHFGQLRLGVYNVRTGGFQRLPFTPATSRDGLYTPVWLNEDRIAYSVPPDGEPPSGASIRPGAASMLADAWRNAWTGSEVTAQVLRNPPDTESESEGAIVCVDLGDSQTRILANGRFAGLKASSSGRYLAAAELAPENQIPDANLIESDRRSFELAVLTLDKPEQWRPLTNAVISPVSIEWSADKDSLIVFAWPKDETSRSGRFYLIEPANKSVVKLDHAGLDLVAERERGFRQIPERAIPIGDGVAVFARKISSTEKQTARFSYEDSGDHSAGRADWYYVAPDRKPKNLTASLLTPNAVPMGVSGDDLLILSDEGLFKVTVAGGSTKVSPKLPGTFSAIQSGSVMSRTGLSRQPFSNHLLLAVSSKTQNYAVLIGAQAYEAIASRAVPTGTEPSVIMAGLDQSGEILLRRDRGLASDLFVQSRDSAQQAIPIATLNKHLRDKSVGQWRRISYSVRTGSENEAIETKLTSCILMPNEDTQRKRPPPLVVEVYPNAGPACNDGKNSSQLTQNSPYIWTGRGYAYARLTLPRELIQTDDGPISRMPDIAERGVDCRYVQFSETPSLISPMGKKGVFNEQRSARDTTQTSG